MIKKQSAALGSALFFLIAPGTVAGVVPWLITRWMFEVPFMRWEGSRAAGVALIALGLVPLVDSFRRFAVEGLGTPAPFAPTQSLIVTGFYRRVRNPMYAGVVAIVFGQALLFANAALVLYGAVIWIGFHLFVVGYEERVLKRQYGAAYDDFRKNVPRWRPRLRTWRASS